MSYTPRNWTPTFQLTSIEKPDMSPYLFHMTTSKNLKLILEGEGTGENTGILNIQVPKHNNKATYEIPMVCFTESPPFALDFFRYRWSDNKDRENLKYGIGFDKKAMVLKGVYPTFYAPKKLQAEILKLNSKLKNNLSVNIESLSSKDKSIIQELNELITNTRNTLSGVVRLMFPLLEDEKYQGFIWEREWRYTTPNPDDKKFIFSYNDIRIICCADEDEEEFKKIIGVEYIEANPIQFIRTWKEYDEITDLLNRTNQNSNDTSKENDIMKIKENDINKAIEGCLAEIDNIDFYIDYLENQVKKIEEIKCIKNNLNEQRKTYDKEIEKIALNKAALIEVFKEISGINSINEDLEKVIRESNCETVTLAIAAYQASINADNVIPRPEGWLIKAIRNNYKPGKTQNPTQVIDRITERVNKKIDLKNCGGASN